MDRLAGACRLADQAVGGIAVADGEQRIGLAHLLAKRRAHRSARHEVAVADAAARVDDDECIIEGQPGALEAVIHDNEVGALFHQLHRALHPLAGNDGQRLAGEQQGLVSDGAGTVVVRIDDGGDIERATIAAREETGFQAARLGGAGKRNRRRRLAGPADSEIADADDRHRHLGAAAVAHAPSGNQPIEARHRPQRIGAPIRLRPPERRRFTYHCSSPRASRPGPRARKRETAAKINCREAQDGVKRAEGLLTPPGAPPPPPGRAARVR